MSNEQLEESTYSSRPVELYLFEYGSDDTLTTYGYTDADFDITKYIPGRGSIVFQADYVERNEINISQTLDKTELEILVDEESDISDLFRVYPPGEVVGATIFRAHWDEGAGDVTEPAAIWVGRVLSCSREGSVATLTCESAVTSFRRTGLRRHYQYMCPHVLYSSACGVSQAEHTIEREVLAVNPKDVTVAGEVTDQYRGGILTWETPETPPERRTIIRAAYDSDNDQTVLTLAGNPQTLESEMTVEISKGCSHTLQDCRDVFDNVANFGGMPYIPTKNPHGTTSIYN